MHGPFAGVRVLDFTTGLAGAMASMLFADFDADVVRVSRPGRDASRSQPGFLCWDRNKRRVALDVTLHEGLRAARELLAMADVAVFDGLPGELERLGLDSGTLLEANPRLLHAWLPPYATEGRWSHLPPDELLLQGLTGTAWLQYSFAERPVALVTPQLGYAHATIAANGIAAGLWERMRSGRGQAVVVSGLHAFASVNSGGAIRADSGSIRLARTSRGGIPHYRLYRCADGEWLFLGALTAPFFLRALEAVDLLDLMVDPGINGDFSSLFRNPGHAIATARLEERFAQKPRAEWLRLLRDHGVPNGPVGTRDEWFRSETVAANRMRLVLDHPEHGPVEMPGLPVKLGLTPGQVRGLCKDVAAETLRDEWSTRRALGPAPAGGNVEAAPLAGVRILDLGAFVAGTFAPTVLASYGADVVKIEPPTGDAYRPYGLMFLGHNLGKRSLAIDIRHPEGRRVLEALVRQCDVVLDNFRLGVRERLGIDYATLSAINPRVITCSVTGYGPTGPLASEPGFDPLIQARSGMMRAQGGDDEPVFHQIAVNDSATAMMAAFGIQAALHARETTGRGQEVHTCLANQSVLFQSGELTWYEGRRPSPTGGLDFIGPRALQRFYACADGWIGVSCSLPGQFQALAIALGHPEWAGRMTAERAFAEGNDGDLAGLIAAAVAALSRADALDRLCTQGVPAAPAIGLDEMFAHPWHVANRFFQTVDDPLFGRTVCVRGYSEWGRSAGGILHAAPAVGEHSLEILAELGLDADQIGELLASGVVVSTVMAVP